MPEIQSSDLSVLRSGHSHVRRYLAVGPRTPTRTFTITAVNQDSGTNGIYSLDVTDEVGDNIVAGQTIDIGSSPGLSDIGKVRARKQQDSGVVFIAETAPGVLAIQPGYYGTVIDEYRPWSIRSHLVPSVDGDGLLDGYTEYQDYDNAYGSPSLKLYPKANITAGASADGLGWLNVKPAGFVDGYRTDSPETYRTVHLDALASVMLVPGTHLDSVFWILPFSDTLTASDTSLDVQFDVGFRHIWLMVIDDAGNSHIMRMPIWVFDGDTYSPITNFSVPSDETEAGRDLTFEFFGPDDSAGPTVIPEGTVICYFEDAEFGPDNSPAPEQYRDQFLGWATEDSSLFVRNRSRYQLHVGGIQWWMEHLSGTSQNFIDTDTTPTVYSEMHDFTIDHAIDRILWMYSTFKDIACIFYTGVSSSVQDVDIDSGNFWDQVRSLAQQANYSIPGVDSLGSLFLRPHYSYLTTAERRVRPTVISLTAADWTDAEGLSLPDNKVDPVGVVNGGGRLRIDAAYAVYASIAPGHAVGPGVGSDEVKPGFWLPSDYPQAKSNSLIGHRFAHLNNPRPNVSLRLIGNLDIVEPAWNEPVSLTWAENAVRGTTLNAGLFLVRRVSIEHSNERGQPPRTVTWTLEQVTYGRPGETVPVVQLEGVTPVEDDACSPVAAFSTLATGLAVQFTDESTGPVDLWLWDFGDGTFGSDNFEPNPLHIYSDDTPYIATLSVFAWCGGADSVSHAVAPVDDAVSAGFTAEVTGTLEVTITDTASAWSGIVGWSYDWGDGTSPSTDQNPVHTYAEAGVYTITQIVTSTLGSTDSFSDDVLVDADVVAAFHYTVGASRDVRFFDDSVAQTVVVSWLWDFGDTSTSTDQNPTHTYGGAGPYTVTLTVTDDAMNSDDVSHSVDAGTRSYWKADLDLTESDDTWLTGANYNGSTTDPLDYTVKAVLPVQASQATYSAGVGYQSVFNPPRASIYWEYAEACVVRRMDIAHAWVNNNGPLQKYEIDVISFVGSFPGGYDSGYHEGFNVVSGTMSGGSASGSFVYSIWNDDAIDGDGARMRMNTGTGAGISFTLTGIHLEGWGHSPLEAT